MYFAESERKPCNTRNSKYDCHDNKNVPGKMEDEYDGKIISEITILKSKMHSTRTVDKKKSEKKSVK